MPHHNHIHRIVNGLQKIGAEQRRGKREELPWATPLREIMYQFFCRAILFLLVTFCKTFVTLPAFFKDESYIRRKMSFHQPRRHP
jgi:hypothetical protein